MGASAFRWLCSFDIRCAVYLQIDASGISELHLVLRCHDEQLLESCVGTEHRSVCRTGGVSSGAWPHLASDTKVTERRNFPLTLSPVLSSRVPPQVVAEIRITG